MKQTKSSSVTVLDGHGILSNIDLGRLGLRIADGESKPDSSEGRSISSKGITSSLLALGLGAWYRCSMRLTHICMQLRLACRTYLTLRGWQPARNQSWASHKQTTF